MPTRYFKILLLFREIVKQAKQNFPAILPQQFMNEICKYGCTIFCRPALYYIQDVGFKKSCGTNLLYLTIPDKTWKSRRDILRQFAVRCKSFTLRQRLKTCLTTSNQATGLISYVSSTVQWTILMKKMAKEIIFCSIARVKINTFVSNWNIIVIKNNFKEFEEILWKALGCTHVMKCFFSHYVMVSFTHFHLISTVDSVLLWQVSPYLNFLLPKERVLWGENSLKPVTPCLAQMW